MAISKKLEIIYHNGQPDGIRSIRRYLSTMTTYVIPRPLLSEAKKLTGINRPGIYYLISETDDNKIAQIYVGQTRNGVSRLHDHNRSKDFWNKAIMFLADSKTFSLDMISGLEAFAIGKAFLCGIWCRHGTSRNWHCYKRQQMQSPLRSRRKRRSRPMPLSYSA